MKRMYITKIKKGASFASFAFVWGVMEGYFYPEAVNIIEDPSNSGATYFGVITTAKKYDGFKKLVEDRLFSAVFDFDILGGQYE